MGAKNRRKNLHKHPGPPFQIRGGPGSFSIAEIFTKTSSRQKGYFQKNVLRFQKLEDLTIRQHQNYIH